MSIKKQLVSGIFYTAISKYAGIFISLIVSAILARLLSPDEFGVVAVATVIITFFGIFTDLGISPAIIQNKELTDKDLSNIFSFTIVGGILLSVLFFLSSWLIGKYYKSETLIVICQLLSINLLFSALNIVPNALLYKDKMFRYIAVRSLAVQFIGGILSVIAALAHAGLYALIINPIFSSICIFIISYRKKPQHICFTPGLESIKKIRSFSSYQFLFNVINYFTRNLDKLLIGRYMGMGELGYYEKSYRLMMLPLQNITHVISPVMHPVFSEMQNDLSKLATSYERIIRILAYIGFPLSVLLYFTSTEITLILFGDQWIKSIAPFQILALSVGIQIIMSTSGSIFQAANDTKTLFVCGLFSATLTVSSLLIGIFVFNTLEAISWSICIAFTVNFIQCYWMMYHFTFNRPIHFFIKKLVNPLILTLILAIVLYLYSSIITDSNLAISAIIKGGLFILCLAVYFMVTNDFNLRNKLLIQISRLRNSIKSEPKKD
ncbi:MAG: lipopolysaccharide biosynthesis protein [Parabacteroides sp.]|nr:lipopolysaccharide biosynthesis protein [Parabacteroides sp.]